MSRPSENLFAYGSLLFDPIVSELTGHAFDSVPAILHGYSRRCISRQGGVQPYPAITKDPSGTVCGRVLLGLDPEALERIHTFEMDPPDYETQRVRVDCENGRILSAMTYVILPRLASSLTGTWSPEEFERDHLDRYVRQIIPAMRRASSS